MLLAGLSADEKTELLARWRFWARPEQLAPEGDWTTWVFLGGRGAGKTRAGAEWIHEEVRAGRAGQIALIAETFADARDVMIEGVSGLIETAGEGERPFFEPSKRRLTWPNGAVALVFSAEDPESLRGPQFDCAWADEFAKWRYVEETFSMLQFALRLGERPRQMVTTTPRPIPALKRLLADPGTRVTRASTFANSTNLAGSFLAEVARRYGGTMLGRQELDGEIIEEVKGALWTRAMIDRALVREAPPLARIVVAVDPPVSSGPNADACGIVAAGKGEDERFYVLADRTIERASPREWAARVAETVSMVKADRLIAEANQGGELVRNLLLREEADLPLKLVHARLGKRLRALPIAALYEQGRVSHVGGFAGLEDEMCSFDGEGKSPDRMDALVWALTELTAADAGATARLRTL